MAKGWIDTTDSETAAALKTRLERDFGFPVRLSKQAGSSIAYAGGGLILRQKETEAIFEYRGLSRAAAEKLTELSSDNTNSTIYYKKFNSNSNDYAVVGVTTGTKTVVSAVRANEADGWTARFTETTYAADATTGWSTTRPSYSNGITVARSAATTFADQCTVNGVQHPVYATNTTEVVEHRHRTESEARTLLSTNDTNTASPMRWKYTSGSFTYYAYIPTGTIKTPTMRQVSADEGWTVTVTTQTLSASGEGWSRA